MPAALSSRVSTASIESRMARTISGKPITRAGERRAGPAEGEDDAEMLVEERADRPAPAEQDQQQIAGHHRRQDQRQVHERSSRLLPQNRPRASSQAMAMPSGRLAAIAVTATSRLSRTAVHSSCRHVELADFTSTVKPLLLEGRPRLAALKIGRGTPWHRLPWRSLVSAAG